MSADLKRLCEIVDSSALEIRRERSCDLVEAIVRATLTAFAEPSSSATAAAGLTIGELLDQASRPSNEAVAHAVITAAIGAVLADPTSDRYAAMGRPRNPRLGDRVLVESGGRTGHVAMLALGSRDLRVAVVWDRSLDGYELDHFAPDACDAGQLVLDGSTGSWLWPEP